jgi:hypothetical protein
MSSVDQTVIILVEGVSIWGVPGLEVDSCVHEVRNFDRHLPFETILASKEVF